MCTLIAGVSVKFQSLSSSEAEILSGFAMSLNIISIVFNLIFMFVSLRVTLEKMKNDYNSIEIINDVKKDVDYQSNPALEMSELNFDATALKKSNYVHHQNV